MRVTRGWRRLTPLIAFLLLVPISALGADGFSVIVNEKNPISSMTRDRAARIFMKKEAAWEEGDEISPVDRFSSSSVRKRFTRAVHGKTVSAIKSYWRKQIFTGRGVPPPEKASDAAVVSFVEANRGAIGYVSPEAAVTTVKVVRIRR